MCVQLFFVLAKVPIVQESERPFRSRLDVDQDIANADVTMKDPSLFPCFLVTLAKMDEEIWVGYMTTYL